MSCEFIKVFYTLKIFGKQALSSELLQHVLQVKTRASVTFYVWKKVPLTGDHYFYLMF